MSISARRHGATIPIRDDPRSLRQHRIAEENDILQEIFFVWAMCENMRERAPYLPSPVLRDLQATMARCVKPVMFELDRITREYEPPSEVINALRGLPA